MFDLVRMRMYSQNTRDVERIHQLRIHLLNISKDQHLKRNVFEASILATTHMSMSTSNLDYDVPRQECVPPVCEVHLPNYLLSVQMHEDEKLKRTRQCKCTCKK